MFKLHKTCNLTFAYLLSVAQLHARLANHQSGVVDISNSVFYECACTICKLSHFEITLIVIWHFGHFFPK